MDRSRSVCAGEERQFCHYWEFNSSSLYLVSHADWRDYDVLSLIDSDSN